MQINLPTSEAFTSNEEGPYTADPRDDGNWSSGKAGVGTLIGSDRGCGAPATIAYVLKNKLGIIVTAAWMKALPDAIYQGMFVSGYWDLINADALPSGLDVSGMDYAWNRGPGTSAHTLQRALGVTQDGQIGPQTLAAIADPPIATMLGRTDRATLKIAQAAFGLPPEQCDGVAGPVTAKIAASNDTNVLISVIAAFSSQQMIDYRGLYNWSTYGAGWTARTGRRLATAINLATAPAKAAA